MPTRNVNLTDHFDKFITRVVASGEYSNASEVVRDGLRLVEERKKEQRAKLQWLRNAANEGAADIERGDFVDLDSDVCIIPPNSFALARTVEYFRIPRNVLVVCLGKSTYARCGIITNVTPFEPEWEGYVTLEISNTTPLPAKIYANEGIAQVVFFEATDVCEVSYKDKAGKYQGQRGITLPRL